jgi:hypothetical protein
MRLPTSRIARRRRRRAGIIIGSVAIAIGLVVALQGTALSSDMFPPPSSASLADLSLRGRIVAIAKSQVGYRTEPPSSYCNKFSSYWNAGMRGCPSGERAEEWCADFAAWVWRTAGVHFAYGYGRRGISAAPVRFYEWGVATGRWHPATAGYVAAPGDVAVYGLSFNSHPSAVHVAVVIDDPPGQRGPNVVNGDGDRTGFSVVETGNDEERTDSGQHVSTLSGYVSPP